MKDNLTKSKIFDDVWIFNSKINHDRRGLTYEWFNSTIKPTGFANFYINQLLTAVSEKNVIRGIHFSKKSNSQFKLIKCISGKILDVVIDLRIDSETFGKHDIFEMDSNMADTIMISEGYGHGYQVLSDKAIVQYALQTNFKFAEEFVINPYDPILNIPWRGNNHILSDRDCNGISFETFLIK